MGYAGAVGIDRGRCYRFVYDEHGKPANRPEPPIATGWLMVGTKSYQVDSCGEHSAQLRRRGPNGPITSLSTRGIHDDGPNQRSQWRRYRYIEPRDFSMTAPTTSTRKV